MFMPEIDTNQKANQSLIPQKEPIDRYSRSVKRAGNLTKSALASTGFWEGRAKHQAGCGEAAKYLLPSAGRLILND
jgi:hypothetical protein